MKRYALIYLATVLIMAPLDFLFLGVIAKGFFKSQVGDMLTQNPNMIAAVLFYLVYGLGLLVFVNGGDGATAKSALIFGALFGIFAYATFDLTTLAILRHWTWPAAAVDISWGAFATAVSSSLGLIVGSWIATRV